MKAVRLQFAILLLGCSCLLRGGIPPAQGSVSLSVRDLSRLNPQASSEVLRGDSWIVASKGGSLAFSLERRIAGDYEIRVEYLDDRDHAKPEVHVDGLLLVEEGQGHSAGSADVALISVKTSLIDSGLHRVELTSSGGMPIAIRKVSYDLLADCFSVVDPSVWNTAFVRADFPHEDLGDTVQGRKKAGSPTDDFISWNHANATTEGWVSMSQNAVGDRDETAYAMTYLHLPIPWSHVKLILQSTTSAELFVNGELVGSAKPPDYTLDTAVAWGSASRSTITRVSVEMENAPDAAFHLKASPLSGGAFYREPPRYVDDRIQTDSWPSHTITNGLISADIALPGNSHAFYRGVRFERAGIITSLRYSGHEYFGKNYNEENRNPVCHDHVAGQSEEFLEPIGYDDARVGEGFMKIGVGILERPFYPVYANRVPYKPIAIFPWKYSWNKNQIVFEQSARMGQYAYTYTKTITAVTGLPLLRIDYKLTNNGERAIRSSQYAHNFISFDGESTVGYRLYPPDGVSVEHVPKWIASGNEGWSVGAPAEPDMLEFSLDTSAGGGVITRLTDQKGKIGIYIYDDFNPEKYQFFVTPENVCPEIFFELRMNPGETVEWERSYEMFIQK